MKRLLSLCCLVGAASGAQALTLDFGAAAPVPNICSATADGLGASQACTTFGYLLQSYGDVAGVVDVSYSNSVSATSLQWWDTGYNDLYGVSFGPQNSTARIELKPLNPGDVVTLTGFDMGAFPNTTSGTHVNVYAIGSAGPALFSYTGTVGSGSTSHTSFAPNVSSVTGLRIEWYDDSYNVGMDNISYTVGSVPEPSAAALLLGGLAGVGALARRRRAG